MECFKDRNPVSESRKITRRGKRRRTRANQRDLLSRRPCDKGRGKATSVYLIIRNEALKTADRYRRSFDAIRTSALALILLLAHATADGREAVLFTNDIGCTEIISLQNRPNEMWDVDFNRTAGYAGRIFAIDAP